MYRRLVLVLTVLIVVACAPVTPAAAPASVEKPPSMPPAAELPSPWDAPYAKVPPELCRPDKEPVERPLFTAPVPQPYEGRQVKEVWVQYGLFANEQGELFRIDVIGVVPETVKFYTENVRVCLDQIFTGELTSSELYSPRGGFAQPSEVFGVNKDDLSIEVYLLGFFDPKRVSAEEVIKKLFDTPVQRWPDSLKAMELTPEQARPEESKQDYVIDFVIDPTANNWGTHHYPERSGTKAWASLSVAGGGGSVKGALCRDGGTVDSTTVTKGGVPESDDMSHDNGGVRTTYDLGVKGNANGTYRVSGRWRWAGWSAAYLDPAPAGSLQNCNP